METNFELKNITKNISAFEKENIKSFILNFSDGTSSENIMLCGTGELKESIKV